MNKKKHCLLTILAYMQHLNRLNRKQLVEGFPKLKFEKVMNTYFCPHLMFNSGYLIEFICLKSDLIDNFDN